MRGAEAWPRRGGLKASERFEAGGRQKGGKELAAGQSLVGIHQPREGTPASTDRLVVMWTGRGWMFPCC